MNAENRSRNIADELTRANEALEIADRLASMGYPTDVVANIYFSLLYHVRAALLTKGLEPKSHDGALRLLALHFEKDGHLPHGSANLFGRLMKSREEADYETSIRFNRDDYLAMREAATSLADALRRIVDSSA